MMPVPGDCELAFTRIAFRPVHSPPATTAGNCMRINYMQKEKLKIFHFDAGAVAGDVQ